MMLYWLFLVFPFFGLRLDFSPTCEYLMVDLPLDLDQGLDFKWYPGLGFHCDLLLFIHWDLFAILHLSCAAAGERELCLLKFG